VQYGQLASEWDEWAAYEAISNVAYAHLPCWVVCTYNGSTTPGRMLDAVWRTHPEMIGDDPESSDYFESPADFVRRLTPRPAPLPGLRTVPAGDDLQSFREHLAGAMTADNVPPAPALDMLVAATEVAANAIKHGGGLRQLRVGTVHCRFVCEIGDHGSGFDDSLAGYVVPRDEHAGSGLWVARQLSWRLELIESPEGFAVRLWL
jgi:anti-sigma regulatory factor (Ser/Thr protein kinase)